jgi:beta-lactam-binding protein with PASTA domain
MFETDATALLHKDGYVVHEVFDCVPRFQGDVQSQDPAAGTPLPRGSIVTITVGSLENCPP